MKRSLLATAATFGLLLAGGAPSALAATTELGLTKTPIAAPVCPTNVSASNCKIILTRSTGLESIRDGVQNPTTAKANGVITAFTVGLSRLSTNLKTAKTYVHYLDHEYGGTTQLAVAVLKPVGGAATRQYELVAESPLYHVQPYLGTVTQFPLTNNLGVAGAPAMAAPLPIARGDVVALTVPTWAPVLTFGLSTANFAYRQSRLSRCQTTSPTQQAQLKTGTTSTYACDYTGTRVEYSATEITTPVVPKTQVDRSTATAQAAAFFQREATPGPSSPTVTGGAGL